MTGILLQSHDFQNGPFVPSGTEVRVHSVVGDSVYVYFGVMSDPLLIPKEMIRLKDEIQ